VKRVLEAKSFARWCKLSDETLCTAAREIEAGQYEADLGKGVVKKRVAYPGKGKSGGARLLVAQRMKASLSSSLDETRATLAPLSPESRKRPPRSWRWLTRN
jgi:hypothetical protein